MKNVRKEMRLAHGVSTFKKWDAKSYSVFNSLHKLVRVGCLATAYLSFALPANADENLYVANRDTSDQIASEVQVEEVVVSALRAPVAFPQVARIVSVIGKKEIEHAPVQSLQDLLEYALNVDIRQRGNNGVQADVSIRGGSFDQVLVLLNGINITDPQTGHHNLNLPISFDAVERIEILEGPASRVYGPNAFSGAINIITATSNTSKIKVHGSAGEHGFYDAGVSGTAVAGKMKHFVSANQRKSNGYIENTDFEVSDLFYQGQLITEAGKFEVQAGYTERAFGANSFYTPAYPAQFEEIKTTFASLKMEMGNVIRFAPAVYWRRNQDRFELFRGMDDSPSWYSSHNYHLTDVYGTNFNAWFTSPLGKTAFGADFRSENIWSTVLGKPMDKPISAPGEEGIEFTNSDTRTNFSLFFEHSLYLEKLVVSAGLMTNWNTHLGIGWDVYPGIDVSYAVLDDIKWYSSVNKSLRMPSFTDLYYNSPTSKGNTDLKPEQATTFETGIKVNKSAFTAHAAYFRRWGKNMIDWVRLPEETVWYAQNLTELNTHGIEFAAKLNPDLLIGEETFLNRISVSYAYLDQNKKSSNYASRYVLDFLKHKLDIGLTHRIYKNIGANWQFSYQDRNGNYTKWEGSDYGEEVPYDPYWLVDARLFWKKDKTNIYIEVSNLLDKSYYDFGNVTQPGRWLKVGFTKQINL